MRNTFLFLLLTLLLIPACQRPQKCEKEVYLLPENFHGPLFIYFNQKDGKQKEYEDGARVYRIPPDGILMSQFPMNGGCMNGNRLSFYTVDSLGKRKPVFYFLDMKGIQIPPDQNYVLFTLLSDKMRKPDFVIHIIGNALEFKELVEEVRKADPGKIFREHR